MNTETLINADYARSLANRAANLKAELSKHFSGFCYASLSFKPGSAPFNVYASGKTYSGKGIPEFSFNDDFASFEEGLDAAEQAFAVHIEKHDEAARRKMALAIIELTDAEGSVTDRALRLAGFSQAQIDLHAETAAALANEMAGKGPFTVVLEGAGNHAEAV